MLSTSVGDDIIENVVAVESEAEIDEEKLEDRDTITYDELANVEGVMFETTQQYSLRDTIMVSSSKATIDETPGSDSKYQSVTPDTDASTDVPIML